MPIYGLTPTSLPTWRISNEMHGNAIGPIRSRGTKLSILIGSLAEGPGILLENELSKQGQCMFELSTLCPL